MAILAIAGWTLTTGASYKLVAHFAHIRPVTAVSTSRPEVGVIIDASARQLPELESALSARGLHVSFAVDRATAARSSFGYGDQLLPRLPHGGLVRWMGARGQLRHMLRALGFGRHFLYASSGPSVGQWLVAHGAGGRLVGGAITIDDARDGFGALRPGEVVELNVGGAAISPAIARLSQTLQRDHLRAVPVGRLMSDAAPSV